MLFIYRKSLPRVLTCNCPLGQNNAFNNLDFLKIFYYDFLHQTLYVHGNCFFVAFACNFFYFRSIAVNITVYLPYLFLPTHVQYIFSGHFCAPEYCSIFAGIQMSLAYTVCLLHIHMLHIFHKILYSDIWPSSLRPGFESCALSF